MRSSTPKSSAVPRPFSPQTPVPWASSTTSRAPCLWQTSQSSRSGAMSPCMEYTPSTTTILARVGPAVIRMDSRSSTSLCRKKSMRAPEILPPQTRLACAYRSRRIRSLGPASAAMQPIMAWAPLLNTRARCVRLKSASIRSSSSCNSMVPVRGRAPIGALTPYLATASIRRLPHAGVPGQAQVIVRAELEDLPAIDVDPGAGVVGRRAAVQHALGDRPVLGADDGGLVQELRHLVEDVGHLEPLPCAALCRPRHEPYPCQGRHPPAAYPCITDPGQGVRIILPFRLVSKPLNWFPIVAPPPSGVNVAQSPSTGQTQPRAAVLQMQKGPAWA